MSLAKFDRGQVEEQLSLLGARQKTAFVALCAERLLPYYRWFSRVQRWGSYSRLEEALAVVWMHVDGHPSENREYERMIAECRKVTPDTEDFESPLAARAMDAAVAVVQTLKMCLEPSDRRAAEVAEVAIDAAFGVEQVNTPHDLGQVQIADRAQLARLFGSGRVQRELETQAEVLEALRSDTAPLQFATLRERYGLAS